jgi:hypothetical protein
VGRRLSTRITTRTGDSWLMCDPMFSAVTLQRTTNKEILSIIVSGDKSNFSHMAPLTSRYISSKPYHCCPLFPILFVADAALDDYRNLLDDILSISKEMSLGTHVINFHPEDFLARIMSLRGDLNAFHASVLNVLNLNDGRDASILQSPATQAGGQVIPIPSLDSMLRYLVSAAEDILVRSTVTDTILQNASFAVCIRYREPRVSLLQY